MKILQYDGKDKQEKKGVGKRRRTNDCSVSHGTEALTSYSPLFTVASSPGQSTVTVDPQWQ